MESPVAKYRPHRMIAVPRCGLREHLQIGYPPRSEFQFGPCGPQIVRGAFGHDFGTSAQSYRSGWHAVPALLSVKVLRLKLFRQGECAWAPHKHFLLEHCSKRPDRDRNRRSEHTLSPERGL